MAIPEERLAARDFVQSLERGLAVIEAFDESSPVLTLSEVSRRTGLTRAAARRFLLTLVELGYMRNEGGRFSLRPRALQLGYAYLSSLSLPQIALPYMRNLSTEIKESASLSVRDDEMIVYVAQVTAARPLAVRIDVGTRFPAYATAMGRVLLAYAPKPWLDSYLSTVRLEPLTPFTISSSEDLRTVLDGVRRTGYVQVEQELDSGLRSLAVPIHDRSGDVIAAMNISTHTAASGVVDVIEDLLPRLQAAARQVEDDIRAKHP